MRLCDLVATSVRGVNTIALIALFASRAGAISIGVAEQWVEVKTGFGDPENCRITASDPSFAEEHCVATEASQRFIYPPYPNNVRTEVTSVGSSVTDAQASPGTVGASVYTGYLVGYDNYYGYAKAHSSDNISITGPANGTASILVGGHVNGGIGLYGSDAAATARAYYRFSGESSVVGSRDIFRDDANGEEIFDDDGYVLPPQHTYDYGIREDYRTVLVPLDAAGNGTLWVELILEVSAYEEGDENQYLSASAADYGNTVNGFLQPASDDIQIVSETGWNLRPFGTPLDVSPDPVTLTREQLGVPEPSSALLAMMGAMAAFLASPRRRR